MVTAHVLLAILRIVYRQRDRVLSALLHDVADTYDPSDMLDERYTRDTPAVAARAQDGVNAA